MKVTPLGNAPDSLLIIDALVGKPMVVTVNVPGRPAVKLVVLALVICGAWKTWNDCWTCSAGL